MTKEEIRLEESRRGKADWKRWGPYLCERAWGNVREDYSEEGTPWEYFPHEHARSRAYRWTEDGLGGICDRRQFVCFALALWNGRDPILKERAFGLTGNEGRHGEDVKEYYFYLDSTPTHSYLKYLYKYPQRAFPYKDLVEADRRRTRDDPELKLADLGLFAEQRYFDVFVEYAKAAPEEILIRLTVVNRGPDAAPLDVLPTLWFRNTWSWGLESRQSLLRAQTLPGGKQTIHLRHSDIGERWLVFEGSPELLFTGNDTNNRRLFGSENHAPYVKDGFHDYVVSGAKDAINPDQFGTKAAVRYRLDLAAGETRILKLRLTAQPPDDARTSFGARFDFGRSFDETFSERIREADEFYQALAPAELDEDTRRVQRQAFAGLLWNKQFYHYEVRRWLRGDPAGPLPPPQRKHGRNSGWAHLYNAEVLSVPDKWEFPWYASWDLAFHCIPLALIDPDFAKDQLILLLREWYMHPNGQIPAYEWALSDASPPVHAWAAWRVYKIEQKRAGHGDRLFLERVFHKLLLNFTWWVNRKDADGNNIFEGGFLGLDNIGPFDRSRILPGGESIEQSDATSWMGMYCLNMMTIALELSRENPAYEDVATKFLEHFVYISRAMNDIAGQGIRLWDHKDGFYYDVLKLSGGQVVPLRLRSMVGLIPLFAVETLDSELVDTLRGFKRRMQWFIDNLPEFSDYIETLTTPTNIRRFLSLVNRERLPRLLNVMLSESEFLSPYGIRSVSKAHKDHPYVLTVHGREFRVEYEPGESRTGLFGGNSNWRGPVWFPVNYLIIESLQKFHYFLGDEFLVEFPTGSGRKMNLWDISMELERRLTRLFLRDATGRRPIYGADPLFQADPHWRDLILFHEYFHGDTGAGLGASHQTGWTGLVAKLIQQCGGAAGGVRQREEHSEFA